MTKVLTSKKIVIVSQTHLCRNPRVLKEAETLCQQDYNVIILTAIYDDQLLEEDKSLIGTRNIGYEFYSDLRGKNLRAIMPRLIRRIATELQEKFNIESVFSLGYNPRSLLKICVGHRADIYIMHQELASFVGTSLLAKSFKVAFDLEDWYSEDLLPEARSKRPIHLLKQIENVALKKGVYCTTTSAALSSRLAEFYSASPPAVIYNVFPRNPALLKNKSRSGVLKLLWFSQTIGPGRGLEQFIKMLGYVNKKIHLHLLGNITPEYRNELENQMPERHEVFFHKVVSERLLPEKIAQFDIGLALELANPPSRNYTITNKFFQYLQAGLPIITSDTIGQSEGFDYFTPGFKIPQSFAPVFGNKLNEWLSDDKMIQLAMEKAILAADYFCWENESKKLINLIENAIDNGS